MFRFRLTKVYRRQVHIGLSLYHTYLMFACGCRMCYETRKIATCLKPSCPLWWHLWGYE